MYICIRGLSKFSNISMKHVIVLLWIALASQGDCNVLCTHNILSGENEYL